MDLLSGLAIVIIITGIVVCSIKMRSLKDKIHDSSATRLIIGWIIGTTVWGGLSIFLIVWWLIPRLL